MITDFSTGASHEPVASCATAFACLLRLGGHAGSDGKGGAVSCHGIVEGDSLPLSRLVELAGELGLEAEYARSDWQGLQTIGFKHSIFALLKNTNLVVLTGAVGSGGEALAVWDPLDRHDRVHFVPREKFEAVWTGEMVIITKEFLQTSESPKTLDFCWITPAGLQLLGKKSANRQRTKLFHRATENAGGEHIAGARNSRQHPDAVLACNSSGKLADAAGTAMEDASRPPVPALTGRGEWRRVSRLYLGAAVILAIGITGLFLLRDPAGDIFAIAINAATKASEEVANSGSSTDQGSTKGADRLPQNAPRLRAANAIFSPPSVPNTALTQPSPMDMRSHQAAVRVEAAMNSAPRSATASLLPSALAEPPPELASCAPALSDHPAAGVAGIPSGSTAETNSGFATASPATSPPPATASAPAGSNPEATSGMPLAAAAPEASATAAPATPPNDPAPTIIPAANAAPAGSSAPAATAASTQAKSSPVESSAEPRFSAAEIAALLARGDALLSTGDVTSARLFYQRAADAGAGLAAVRLGETFDPAFLDRARFRGARGDPGQAVSWYRRARDLGVADAEFLLKALQ